MEDLLRTYKNSSSSTAAGKWLQKGVMNTLSTPGYKEFMDFTQPVGDPGVHGPESINWKVMSHFGTTIIGGMAAAMLELIEPGVDAAVWRDWSSFKSDPNGRMRRTGAAAMITVYGGLDNVKGMTDRVRLMHQKVKGQTRDGEPYNAFEPDRMIWVQLTAAWGFLQAWQRYGNHPLTIAEQDQYYAEGELISRYYGNYNAPKTVAGVDDFFEYMRPKLKRSEAIEEFVPMLRRLSPYTFLSQPAQRVFVNAAIDILPAWAQRQMGLESGHWRRVAQRPLVKALVKSIDVLMQDGLAQQACRRVGADPAVLRF